MATVLFVCLQNAGRSQISEALFTQAANGKHKALSAGTTPADHVHPEVVEVMRELGIDLADRQPRMLTRELAEQADIVVTMGCGDQCPYIPGKKYIDWNLPTPPANQSSKSAKSKTRSPNASRRSLPSSTTANSHLHRELSRITQDSPAPGFTLGQASSPSTAPTRKPGDSQDSA